MKVLNLNVVYAQVKENDEVTRAYTMSNPLPTSLELTSNQILQIAGDSVWGSANIESSSVYDRVGYEMTTDRLTFTSSNPSAVTVDSKRRYRDYSSDDCIGIRTYIGTSCRRNSLGMG